MKRAYNKGATGSSAEDSIYSSSAFLSLPEEDRLFIREKAAAFRMSRSYLHELIEAAVDLRMWDDGAIAEVFDESAAEKRTGKQRTEAVFAALRKEIDALRSTLPDYRSFRPDTVHQRKHVFVDNSDSPHPILGTCPVAGEKTRCCNLETLDAVKQCGFACSYCSIRSFYDADRIYFHSDLKQRLESIDIDPDRICHIGTGQSSDSLMFGNHQHLLDDLCRFAADHPNVILEMKSKSANTGYFRSHSAPGNMLFTWSLNPRTVIENEEHLTASLADRIGAAREMADRGYLVGFHLHPIIRYEGWQEEYASIFSEIQERFSPDETVMISFGTLTFIKPVMKQLRSSGLKSKVLRIPLDDAAGKFSYPFEIKKDMFSFAYGAFSDTWKKQVFFYLCMEDPALWEPVFGFSYPNNEAFETAMKQAYMKKIRNKIQSY